MVLIAAGLIVLLGFVGLAVDLGMVWVRDAQLQAGVDSAALAGAPELSRGGQSSADQVAQQFLFTNKLPGASIESLTSSIGQSLLGERQYTLTVTWTVDLYFMRLFAFNQVNLVRSATAAYFPLTDIYASSRGDDGALNVSNQALFGPRICTSYGDPYSPWSSRYTPGPYTYQYRIFVPSDYEANANTSLVRVEILDPDSINSPDSQANIIHTQRWLAKNPGKPLAELKSCSSTQVNPCLITTCEWSGSQTGCAANVNETDVNLVNPFWFVRIDENRGAGGNDGNDSCDVPSSYTTQYNTSTQFALYYFKQNPDGTLSKAPLASYTGQSGRKAGSGTNIDADVRNHGTDLRWTTPGAFNDFGEVPTDCGSITGGYLTTTEPNRCPGANPADPDAFAGPGRGFEIDLSSDVTNIVKDRVTGARYIYLDVTTLGGASENGFALWAGPPNQSVGLPSDANLRNIRIADNPNQRTAKGVAVYAMGTLPMNSNGTQKVQIPLIYVPAEYAGRNVYISLFDTDAGTTPPLYFYFDSVPRVDYQVNYSNAASAPDGLNRCFFNNTCNDKWVGNSIQGGGGEGGPGFVVKIPDLTPECATSPSQYVCNPFYGGVLYAEYNAGADDTYIWEVNLPSFPYLVK